MERMYPVAYAAIFFWGIAVLVGLIGLGRLVARAIGEEAAENAGWGLHAVWGMGAYLFLGGLLAACGACGATAITLLIGAGIVVTVWTTVRGGWPTRASLAAQPWALWPAFAIAAFLFAAGLCWQGNVNAADDFVGYYEFCEKLLSTGSFPEPFSWRRLASLGGHTLLQSTMLANGWWANVQSFETSLCPVILLGLVAGFRGGALRRSPAGLFLALLAITTPIIRVNTASHATGLVLFAGLFCTLDIIGTAAVNRGRYYAVAGLVAAGLASLRAQNVPAAGGALGLFWLLSWIRDRPAPRIAIRQAVWWGCGLLAGLLPWMIMGWISNGSPLFPLFQGGNNLAFDPQVAPGPLYFRLKPALEAIVHPAIFPLLICLLAVPGWKRGLAGLATVIAAALTSLALAYAVSLAPDNTTIPRYVQPLLIAGALAALMTAAVSPRGRMTACAFSVFLAATTFTDRGVYLLRYYSSLSLTSGLNMTIQSHTLADHKAAQDLVPKGKRVMVCSDFPFLFDHERNPVWTIDLPNGCSPAPGLPFHKPPEETKRYFRNLGIDYLIFVDPAQSLVLYNRKVWEGHLHGEVALWRVQAPFYLDYFDTMERLAGTEQVLGKAGNLIVVHLDGSPASATPQ
jgi:hypothetical protein